MNVVHSIQECVALHLKKNKQHMRERKDHQFACCFVVTTVQLGSFAGWPPLTGWMTRLDDSLMECPGSFHLIACQHHEHLSVRWPEDNPSHI